MTEDMPQPSLKTAYVFSLFVDIAPVIEVGETGFGNRRLIPIAGGTLKGPGMNGRILNMGADYLTARPTGLSEVHARYAVEMDDGAKIYVENIGIRIAPREVNERLARGESVDQSLIYFRTVPRFETGAEKYRWMMETVFVGSASRRGGQVVVDVHRVL